MTELHRAFDGRRREMLARRVQRRHELGAHAVGAPLDFPASTAQVRDGEWQVAASPPDLTDRRVEITGPVDRKMMINALNSGARVFMADLEDACSPTWANVIAGQQNLMDAVPGTRRQDERAGGHALPGGVAARQRRGSHRQSHGRRRHGRITSAPGTSALGAGSGAPV